MVIQLSFGHLGTTNSREKVPLVVPEIPSPDNPNRESRPWDFKDEGVEVCGPSR